VFDFHLFHFLLLLCFQLRSQRRILDLLRICR
jgi:hypothetical protein